MDSCLLPMQAPFFLARYCEINPPIDTGGCYAHSEQQLARHHEILTARWLHENFMVPFLHNLIYLDQDFSEKSIFMQVKLFCTSKMVGICHLAQLQELHKMILRLAMWNLSTWWWIFWQQPTVPHIFHLQWSCLKSILLITWVSQLTYAGCNRQPSSAHHPCSGFRV